MQERAHPRYAIELDAELVLSHPDRSLRGRTHDISRGGFCMQIPAVDATGSFSWSVDPRSHQNVGTLRATKLAIESARNTRVRMSRVARIHAAAPTAT